MVSERREKEWGAVGGAWVNREMVVAGLVEGEWVRVVEVMFGWELKSKLWCWWSGRELGMSFAVVCGGKRISCTRLNC